MAKIFRTLLVAAVNAIKEFFAFATKECLEAGLKNATIVGELNNEDGVFSGFSVNDRIKIDNNLPSSFNSMTFIVNFKTPNTIGTDDYPIIIQNDAVKDIFLEGSTKTICQWNGSTKNSGITQLQENKDYELKIIYENDSYTCYVDNIQQFTTSNDIFKGALLCFGGSAVNTQFFEGSIDMNNTSVSIDGQTTNFYSTIPEVGDSVKLNDGMATSNYDWSAYPSDTEITGDYTQTGTIEKVKQIGDDFVYGMQEPEQDNKDVTINVGQMYYAYTNANDESVYTTNDPIIPAGTEWTQPILTSNGTIGGDSCAIETDIPQLSDNAAWHGFDNNSSTQFHSTSGNTVGYFTFYSPTPICVTKITFTNQYSASRASAGGTIYGSNDNNNWETITTYIHSNDNSVWDIDLSNNTKFYKYWKVYSNGTRGDSYWTFTQCTFTATKQSTPSTLYENTGTTEFTPVALDPQPSFTIKETGLLNCTNNNCTNLGNGIYQGSAGNNIVANVGTGIQTASKWEICCRYNNQSASSYPTIFAPVDSSYTQNPFLQLVSNKMYLFLRDVNGNDIIQGDTGYTLPSGFHLIQVGWTGTKYYMNVDGDEKWYYNSSVATKSNQDIMFLNLMSYKYWGYAMDMSETYITIDNDTTNFYDPKSGIIIENNLYERNSGADNVKPISDVSVAIDTIDNTTIQSVTITSDQTATIETSANITTSNNDSVITDGGYHFFNLTVPTDMIPIIEGSGASYQVNEMPLLLKNNSNVGLLLKDGNNSYYRNYWVVNRDYDLHYQQINFSYPSGATVTCKVNNAEQSNLAPYVYCGDIVSWTCDNSGTITTGTYTVKYSNLDGNIQTITIS